MRVRAHPYFALAILTALNFLNYIDRSILFQVQPLIQREFGVSKMQIGLLTTAFMICLIVAAPVLGRLADRYRRRSIIATGAMLWSVATLLSGLTWDFRSLLVRHAIVGIGEACMVAAPAYLTDLFPQQKRGRMLAFLYMGGPVGTALGYVIGGLLGHMYGWRAPFYVVAGPGILAALLLLATPEPRRAQELSSENSDSKALLALVRNGAYLSATLGLAMISFAVAGAQVWLPDFLTSVRGLTMMSAAGFVGAITVVNGVAATMAGGWLADRLRQRRHDADYVVCAMFAAAAIPVTLAAVYLPPPWMFPGIFMVEALLLANYAPLGAAVLQSVSPRVRSTAFAFHVVAIRLLGDAMSAPIVGHIADRTGSLQIGLIATVAALALACTILFYGRQFAPQVVPAARESILVGQ